MDVQQALQIKRSLETFFYKVRFNIGLHDIIKSSRYIEFKKNLETALQNQILYYAKFEKVNEIVGLQKAVRTLDDKILVNNLDKIWTPISDILELDELKVFFLWLADRGGQISVNKLKSNQVFNLTNKKIIRDINTKINDFLIQIDGTTKSWIARTVEQGLLDKYSILDIAKALRDDSLSISRNRSNAIAEHETATILGEMALEVYNRSGVETHKWLTSRDERVCINCSANESAGEVRIGSEFPSGSISTPAHIGCRCYDLPVVSDSEIEIWMGQ